MVDLLTVKRVLALDLGMSSQAIASYLDEHWPSAAQSAAITIAEALRVVAVAETLAAAAA